MGSHMNFKSFGDTDNTIGDNNNRKPPENVTLVRQPSIYSLTFDELQNTIGGVGKDFGSMNMDELLKNIWTAEETQALAVASSAGGGGGGEGNNNNNPSGSLQKQGSLTLPRTLSQKTVDEVWRDLIKDSGVADGNGSGSGSGSGGGGSGSTMPQTQRQQTLGEVTLEEFLVRAGVVREDMPQQFARPNSNLWFGDLSRPNNNTGLVLGFQQPNGNKGNLGNGNTPVSRHPPALSLHANPTDPQQQAQQQQHQQPPPLFPKPANVAFAPSMHLLNNAQLASSGTRGGMIGVQGGAALPSVAVAGGSPAGQISPEVFTKSTVDTSSLSPVPYVINRGRKCSAIEKVVERRQRRMIKNRESAARSRARKQAYTLELEAEVQKLKEMNRELETKQAEIMEMQKNQALETMYRPWGCKRQCLRRTLTGPW